jgi:hypothetical protein
VETGVEKGSCYRRTTEVGFRQSIAPCAVRTCFFKLSKAQKRGAVRPSPRPPQLRCFSLYDIREKSQFGKKIRDGMTDSRSSTLQQQVTGGNLNVLFLMLHSK